MRGHNARYSADSDAAVALLVLHTNMFVTAKFVTIMFRRAALPVRSRKEIRPNGPVGLPLRPFRSPCVLARPLPG